MRLAFRIPAQWWGAEALPWFYRIRGGGSEGTDRTYLALDTESLWGQPQHPPGAPKSGSAEGDALKPWREQVMATVPGLEKAALQSLAHFVAPPEQASPYWRSRLGGSAVLPYLAGTSGAEEKCIRWPKDMSYSPGTRNKGYSLHFNRSSGRFRLTAYLTLKAMLQDLRRGRLAAALMDGREIVTAIEARMDLPQPMVGRGVGTQQIVLTPRPGLLNEMEPGTMLALSRAIPRGHLAKSAGPEFMPSQAYFGGTGAVPLGEDEDPLIWDTRGSRRGWLKLQNAPRRVSLALLAHPLLQRVAENLASQWKKTLGLEVDISLLAVEKLYLPGGAAAADFSLMVVDQDDGSLQNLWRNLLHDRAPLSEESELQAAEQHMRNRLPYLPLLKNVQYLLAVSPAAYGRIAQLCPGCEVAPLQSYRRRKRP